MARRKRKSEAMQRNLFDHQQREPRWDLLPASVKAETIRLVQRMLNEYSRERQLPDGGGSHE